MNIHKYPLKYICKYMHNKVIIVLPLYYEKERKKEEKGKVGLCVSARIPYMER